MADSLDYICAWVLSEKQSFDNLIEIGIKENSEQGANICQTMDGNLVFGKRCSGEGCAVELPFTCGESINVLGTFHTHPTDKDPEQVAKYTEFSGPDLILSLMHNERISCLGYEKDGIKHVDCLKFKDIDIPKKDPQVLALLSRISYYANELADLQTRAAAYDRVFDKVRDMTKEQVDSRLEEIEGLIKDHQKLRANYVASLKMEELVKRNLLDYLNKKGYIEVCKNG